MPKVNTTAGKVAEKITAEMKAEVLKQIQIESEEKIKLELEAARIDLETWQKKHSNVTLAIVYKSESQLRPSVGQITLLPKPPQKK